MKPAQGPWHSLRAPKRSRSGTQEPSVPGAPSCPWTSSQGPSSLVHPVGPVASLQQPPPQPYWALPCSVPLPRGRRKSTVLSPQGPDPPPELRPLPLPGLLPGQLSSALSEAVAPGPTGDSPCPRGPWPPQWSPQVSCLEPKAIPTVLMPTGPPQPPELCLQGRVSG